MTSLDSLRARQEAVGEQRLWVRLTRACNNRCLFCHDVGAQNGTIVPEEEVLARLREGRARGCTRAILSGGEPTIHPRFLDLVAAATGMGYSWVQCVSNGRMFAYPKFAARAVAAGLREATLSMHDHTPQVFEELVGVSGAHAQSLQGLRNLLRLGVVVSVDVVLNRRNLPHLKELLEFYVNEGVLEFDLLHLIPFGRGFDDHREALFPEPEMVARELHRALDWARTVPGIFLWTNRLPIELLEGHEDLFQDPHKIYDEVLGERESFRALFRDGTPPECEGPRCPHCFLRPFCEEARATATRLRDPRRARAKAVDDGPGPRPLEVTAAFCREAAGMSDEALHGRVPDRWALPAPESLTEALEVLPPLAEVQALSRRLGRPVQGLPACLGGPRPLPGGEDDALAFQPPDGEPLSERHLPDFIAHFIRHRYRVKSLRCRTCRLDALCRGLPVHAARIWGLGVLQPEQ
ncbi:MAG TPA: radical SAM protein [Myxococcota bacterium]|nr:radical SAM protein [Myxococcota bacterium]HQK51908.1 radical SAM protein [Myxococcota bacterium]